MAIVESWISNWNVNVYIANDDVITVNNDNQIEVDYSDQDGT